MERFWSPADPLHGAQASPMAGESSVGSASGELASRASGGQPPTAALRLDQRTINGSGESQEDRLLICPLKCRSWVCGRCGPGFWAAVGAKVAPHLGIFRKPRLLTLTIDRKRFASGEDAFEQVKGSDGYLRRLLRLMEFKKAFGVLAFHPNAPEWPHWHVLVDVDDPGAWIDLKRMWRLWRDEWGCGGLDLPVRTNCSTAYQAARYAIGYCQHQAGTKPDWVLQRTRLPRAWEAYGELRAAMRAQCAESGETDAAEPEDDAPDAESTGEGAESKPRAKSKRIARSVADRLGDCGHGGVVILQRGAFGRRGSHRWMGSLTSSPGRLALADTLGELPSLRLDRGWRELSNGTRVLDVWIALKRGEKPKDVFERLKESADKLMLIDVDAVREREACDVPF